MKSQASIDLKVIAKHNLHSPVNDELNEALSDINSSKKGKHIHDPNDFKYCSASYLLLQKDENEENESIVSKILTPQIHQKAEVVLEKFDNSGNSLWVKNLTELGIKTTYGIKFLKNDKIALVVKISNLFKLQIFNTKGNQIYSQVLNNSKYISTLRDSKPLAMVEVGRYLVFPKHHVKNRFSNELYAFDLDDQELFNLNYPNVLDGVGLSSVGKNLMIQTKEELIETSFSKLNISDYLSIFPNPTNEVLNVVCPKNTHLYIYSSDGKILMDFLTQKGEEQINISALNSGIYFIGNESKSQMKKFVKAGK